MDFVAEIKSGIIRRILMEHLDDKVFIKAFRESYLKDLTEPFLKLAQPMGEERTSRIDSGASLLRSDSNHLLDDLSVSAPGTLSLASFINKGESDSARRMRGFSISSEMPLQATSLFQNIDSEYSDTGSKNKGFWQFLYDQFDGEHMLPSFLNGLSQMGGKQDLGEGIASFFRSVNKFNDVDDQSDDKPMLSSLLNSMSKMSGQQGLGEGISAFLQGISALKDAYNQGDEKRMLLSFLNGLSQMSGKKGFGEGIVAFSQGVNAFNNANDQLDDKHILSSFLSAILKMSGQQGLGEGIPAFLQGISTLNDAYKQGDEKRMLSSFLNGLSQMVGKQGFGEGLTAFFQGVNAINDISNQKKKLGGFL